MKKIESKFWWFVFVLLTGQATSLALTGVGVFATLLENHTGKSVPTTLTGVAYFILSAVAGPYLAYRPGFVDKCKQHWWKFVILGLADFSTTYLQTLAFDYTSVSSNQVIVVGSSTLFVILLAVFLIKTRYKLIHYLSIIICCGGMTVVVWQDLKSDDAGSNPLLGDLICVAAGFTLAVITVGEEFLLKGKLSIIDFTGMLGFSGAIISSIQLCILDRKTLTEIDWDLKAVLYFLGFHVCNSSYYIFFPLVIIQSSSMVANLSQLTANAYSLVFAIFLFDNKFSAFYIGGFVVIMFGLVLYNLIPAPEGGTDKSVFSTGYWYSYVHSLFCEWRCCPQDPELVPVNSDDNDVSTLKNDTSNLRTS